MRSILEMLIGQSHAYHIQFISGIAPWAPRGQALWEGQERTGNPISGRFRKIRGPFRKIIQKQLLYFVFVYQSEIHWVCFCYQSLFRNLRIVQTCEMILSTVQ